MFKSIAVILLAAQVVYGEEVNATVSQIIGPNGTVTAAPATDSVTTTELNEVITCTTENNEPGECVRFFLCDTYNSTINTDGVGIIDIAGSDDPCPSYLDTCCLVSDKRPPHDPITPKPPSKEVQERQGCGWRNPDGVGFNIGGDFDGEAKFGELPWMVAILTIEPDNNSVPKDQQKNVYIGGGSLITPSAVLSTARPVANAKALRVRAGEWDTQTTKEIYPHQERDVASVDIHKDFNEGNLFYDIAVLFLDKPMDLAPNVAVACLPRAGDTPRMGTRCLASGWGKDKFEKEGRYQNILQKVEVPIVAHTSCRNLLRQTRLGSLFELHHTFVCAGGEKGKNTCKGDGGSPLVCPVEFQKDRYVQSGIVAWQLGCGEDGTPGVYVDVAKLRDWIDDKIAGKGLNIDDYSKY